MAWFDFITGRKKVKEEVFNGNLEYFYYKNIMDSLSRIMKNGEYKFCNADSYLMAKTLVEVFTPIDVIADRVSGINYFIKDKNGERIAFEDLPPSLKRLITKPNFMQNIQSFIYNLEFSELAVGGSYVYPVFNSSVKTKKFDKISQIFVIEPDKIMVNYKNQLVAPFLAKTFSEYVNSYQIDYFGSVQKVAPDDIIVNIDNNFNFNTFEIESPLLAVTRNIENLVVTYSARYNSYASNGAGGIIARKAESVDTGLGQFAQDQDMRQKMIDEMKSADGIVGRKNFIGISSVPLEFIRTLASIKDLMPFEETNKNALSILGVYGVSPFLTPYAEQTTFTNLKDSELSLWQNQIKPRADQMVRKLNEIFYLGEEFSFDYDLSGTPILQDARAEEIDADLKELELYQKLIELGIENEEMLNKWKS